MAKEDPSNSSRKPARLPGSHSFPTSATPIIRSFVTLAGGMLLLFILARMCDKDDSVERNERVRENMRQVEAF